MSIKSVETVRNVSIHNSGESYTVKVVSRHQECGEINSDIFKISIICQDIFRPY